MNITEQFAGKILDIRYPTLPKEAVDIAKQVTLDGLAVTLAGSTEPLGVGRISIEYVKTMGGAPQATVIAGGFKTSMPNAAYANGTMAHALDFDNTWYPLNHPTSPTLPAIPAIGENEHLPGAKFIEAIAAAFEVQARVRLAATGMETGSGFHKPGTTGTLGAVAGAGRALDLDPRQMVMALGLAGSRAGSISINTGTMTKSSHSGHAADAALALRAEHAIDPKEIERIDVVFPKFDYVNRPFPETGLDGKFSVQCTTAVALLDGEITVDWFDVR